MIVGGDFKTYDHLTSLKYDYSFDYNWMVPFIGDFHLLKKFLIVLMSLFWEPGLKDVSLE